MTKDDFDSFYKHPLTGSFLEGIKKQLDILKEDVMRIQASEKTAGLINELRGSAQVLQSLLNKEQLEDIMVFHEGDQ